MSESKRICIEGENKSVNEEEMHKQQFIRNSAFFGEEGQKRIEDAYVCIVGLGGVGSNAAHMLARSGVGRLKFIDFDVVTVSSLNRHAVATRKDIGKAKVEVMRDHILEFNPMAKIEALNTMITKENIGSLINDHPDFVVDCIDDYSTKTDLLEYCVRSNIEVISSMGSGCRSNTTCLLITNITDVKYDPLAAKIRAQLKKRGIVFDSPECVNPVTDSDPMKKLVINSCTGVYIPCISSYERPVTQIMSFSESKSAKAMEEDLLRRSSAEEAKPSDADPSGMRYRTIPVYGCLPVAFGNTICSYILHSLSAKTFRPTACIPLSQDVLLKMYNHLLTKERKLFQNEEVPIDRFDAMFLIQQVFKQRCVFTGKSLVGSKLELCRWDISKLPTMDNVVLASAEECRKHEKDGFEGMDPKEKERIQNLIDTLVTKEERMECYYWIVC